MTLLDKLNEPQTWQDFLAHKRAGGHWSRREDAALEEFVNQAGWRAVTAAIFSADPQPLGLPSRKLVNKLGGRKRVVYTFPAAQTWVLKLLAYLLYCYDDVHSPLCYSFRQGTGAHAAIRQLVRTPDIDSMWCYKLDVSDYFNSINVARLLPMLARILVDDQPLLAFFQRLLPACAPGAEEAVGVLPGTPTAPFLANVYLGGLDRHFEATGLPYARYSDDIILFAPTRSAIQEQRGFIHDFLEQMGLEVNAAKEHLLAPGEAWEFLGVSYRMGTVDLSQATRQKLKGKIRRKARALRRWMLRKQAQPEHAMKVMIRVFNQRFFDNPRPDELTWARWFFPLLTSDAGLREMDAHLQRYIRYIPTGRHNAANYRVSYATLKRLGYRSLVHEWHNRGQTGGEGVKGGGSPGLPVTSARP